jgi:hypothetical protein
LVLRAFDHPVALSGLLAFYLASGRKLKALLDAALGLKFGHFAFPLNINRLEQIDPSLATPAFRAGMAALTGQRAQEWGL